MVNKSGTAASKAGGKARTSSKKLATSKDGRYTLRKTGGQRSGSERGAVPVAVLKNVLGSVPPAAREGFVRAVTAEETDELNPALWGPAPSVTQRREAALATLRRQYQARREVIEASLTRPEVAELLQVSEQAVLDRLDARDLIGLKKGREWRLPAWQFNPDAERGFVPGLAELCRVFPGGVVSMTQWATTSNVELDQATPAQALAQGRVDDVVHAAAAGTSAAW